MKRRRVSAAAAAVAAGLVAGVPSAAAGGPQPAAVAARSAVQCPRSTGSLSAPAHAAARSGAAVAVTVSVPRFTFLVRTRDGWLVRTNTEAPPDRRDHIVVLAGDGWSLAPSSLAELVLRTCG
ncbi:MAG: hypothetical protein QOD07_2785 [Frankiaceae bacterium]|jgi:hypothetical protein|nr:hypothetical protein [Frankiaceae bacterium]